MLECIVGLFPAHPYFPEKSEVGKDISLDNEVRYCVDDYVQMMQFWQLNVAGANGISNETLNADYIESSSILKEYLFSLLDLPPTIQGGNPFFCDDILSSSLNVKKRKLSVIKKSINISSESSKNGSLLNNEDISVLENRDNFNDIEILDGDDSDIDYEYIDSGNNEDYDELEDNVNDNDVI
ncbi:hypothetical protein OJ253_1601 [Cryptosporidium canis]|uniref:Uncharacterized protein n=1 Tax=Cryptosporidium canis TaxID=195482 RepID=A0A9D5DNB5_9CRYT|nr:hypothetical protein OJ253_1601 [Cryptosporidium canis]